MSSIVVTSRGGEKSDNNFNQFQKLNVETFFCTSFAEKKNFQPFLSRLRLLLF
jgi:hypothetical protein